MDLKYIKDSIATKKKCLDALNQELCQLEFKEKVLSTKPLFKEGDKVTLKDIDEVKTIIRLSSGWTAYAHFMTPDNPATVKEVHVSSSNDSDEISYIIQFDNQKVYSKVEKKEVQDDGTFGFYERHLEAYKPKSSAKSLRSVRECISYLVKVPKVKGLQLKHYVADDQKEADNYMKSLKSKGDIEDYHYVETRVVSIIR